MSQNNHFSTPKEHQHDDHTDKESEGRRLAEDVLRCIPADWKPNMARDYSQLGNILAEYIYDLKSTRSAGVSIKEPTEAMIEAGRKAIMGMLEPKREPKTKPTIAELEAILNADGDGRNINIEPDGSVTELTPRTTTATEVAKAAYAAMVAAAPADTRSASVSSEDAACKVAADLLRNEIVRLDTPKAMFPQEAEKIGRRQAAFQEAVHYLDPVGPTAKDSESG